MGGLKRINNRRGGLNPPRLAFDLECLDFAHNALTHAAPASPRLLPAAPSVGPTCVLGRLVPSAMPTVTWTTHPTANPLPPNLLRSPGQGRGGDPPVDTAEEAHELSLLDPTRFAASSDRIQDRAVDVYGTYYQLKADSGANKAN